MIEGALEVVWWAHDVPFCGLFLKSWTKKLHGRGPAQTDLDLKEGKNHVQVRDHKGNNMQLLQ